MGWCETNFGFLLEKVEQKVNDPTEDHIARVADVGPCRGRMEQIFKF